MTSFVEHVYDQYPPKLRMEKYEFWRILKRCHNDYNNLRSTDSIEDFSKYMNDQYGIQIEIVDGNIGPYYNIKDEKKYMLFLLKFK